MSRNLPEEQLIRSYFLGDLPESEEDLIQERAFIDHDFYETLLIIEGELVDDYVLGLVSAQERAKLERGFLMNSHQTQRVRIVRTLKEYIETQTSAIPPASAERSSLFSGLSSRILNSRPRAAERKTLEDAKPASRNVWERLLSEAHANRNLILSLMGDDWLGLRLLLQLESSPLTTEANLFSYAEGDCADLKAVLSGLIECGLVERVEGKYSCSWFGSEILEKIRKLSESPVDL